jgi:hypothetical protein
LTAALAKICREAFWMGITPLGFIVPHGKLETDDSCRKPQSHCVGVASACATIASQCFGYRLFAHESTVIAGALRSPETNFFIVIVLARRESMQSVCQTFRLERGFP